MKKIKSLFELFFIMFKIGIFTFGGGYAMIGILEHEFVEKGKWVEKNVSNLYYFNWGGFRNNYLLKKNDYVVLLFFCIF